ncbi:NAD(P)H-dependent oxidoreductase [Patescibacteria group bacterium]|nr:NAD(P)H-dependent oxidoreductase [Patescibacteria group bacterium]
MKEKIIILFASPNKEGNSASLGKKFLSQIDTNKYEVEEIYLYDWNLNYCRNDNFNFGPEKKEIELEAKELFAKIQNTKHIVVTTPVWNFGVPAIFKNFLDRASNFGRVWSEEKEMKISNWKNKKFYLLFTTGAPKFGLILNFVAIFQTILSIKYYGSKKKIIKVMGNCGNGKKNVVNSRKKELDKIAKKGQKIFS